MLCARCGGSMRSVSAFCPTCGHPVGADPGDTPPPLQAVAPPAPLPRKKRPVAVLAGMVVVLAATGAAGFLTTRSTPARIALDLTPAGPFTVAVSETADGPSRTFDGAEVLSLRPGEYFLDVVPADRGFQHKRLKVHLSSGQMLALPVVLAPAAPKTTGF